MSFLLDALRKSERAASRRSAPTIHSDNGVEQPVESDESDLLPLLAFLTPAFVLMSWFGLQQFDPQTVADANSAAMKGPGAKPSVAGEEQPAPLSDEAVRPRAGAETAPPETRAGQDSPDVRPRTPVERLAADPDRGSNRGEAGPGAPPSLPEGRESARGRIQGHTAGHGK